jgi:hypothetical protein
MLTGRLGADDDDDDDDDADDNDDDVHCSGNVKMAQEPSTKPSSRTQQHVTSTTNKSWIGASVKLS